jgi:hypothetical protein
MREELGAALDTIAGDGVTRVLILTGCRRKLLRRW